MAATTSRKNTGPKLLIAVDFGTTYSAVAWANTDEPESQNLIVDWGKGLTGDKTPSILQYANDGIKWGLDLQDLAPNEKVHEWFKLGLCPEVEDKRATEASLLRDYPSKTALPPVRGNKCKKMVVDYLTKVKEATETHFKPFDRMFYELPREYIITVPAMWSEEAQDATRACAAEAFLRDKSRIDEIQIVAEPEAAGIYALAAMPKLGLKEGDTFVICDAGGGTVDLSSYQVNKLAGYIDLERVSILNGDVCGSSVLNRIFEDYLEKKLGGKVEQWIEPHQRWFKWVVNQNFENQIKPHFTGEKDRDRNYQINAFGFPDNINQGIKDHMLHIPAREVRVEVFDKVISRIKALVLEQVNATGNVKEVLLAGGFGQNEYLKSEIEKAVGNAITVRKIHNSRTAIVRGALIAGLTEGGQLESRRRPSHEPGIADFPSPPRPGHQSRIYPRVFIRQAPKNYGVCVTEKFDSTNTVHLKGRQWVHRFNGGPEMIDRMEWFVEKNEKIPDGETKTFPLSYEREALTGGIRPKTLTCDVYYSDADERPLFPSLSQFPYPAPITLLLTLQMNLDEIRDWKPTLGDDNRYCWRLDFDVHMKLHSAKLSFFLSRGEIKYKPETITYHSQRPDKE